ncbi:hypothetical protein A8V24_11455 [Yersinia pestis]|nr:hypothetical protein AU253_13035 [Yersinia pestis]PCN72384.1 hypothetical protein A8V24_11455 [Yersinia pestis]
MKIAYRTIRFINLWIYAVFYSEFFGFELSHYLSTADMIFGDYEFILYH